MTPGYIFILIISSCTSQEIGTTIYITRWRKIELCAPTDVFSFRGNSTLYKTMEYWNGVGNITRDFTIDKARIQMQKCHEGFYACEKFITLKIDKNVVREFTEAKDQGWSPLYNSLNPKPNSVHVKKGIYTITNATLDVKAATRVLPEFPDYYWKSRVDVYERNDNLLFCVEANFFIVKYTYRERSNKKKTT